jgi:hypothetical protein
VTARRSLARTTTAGAGSRARSPGGFDRTTTLSRSGACLRCFVPRGCRPHRQRRLGPCKVVLTATPFAPPAISISPRLADSVGSGHRVVAKGPAGAINRERSNAVTRETRDYRAGGSLEHVQEACRDLRRSMTVRGRSRIGIPVRACQEFGVDGRQISYTSNCPAPAPLVFTKTLLVSCLARHSGDLSHVDPGMLTYHLLR